MSSLMILLSSNMTFWGRMGLALRSRLHVHLLLSSSPLSVQVLLGTYPFKPSTSILTALRESPWRFTQLRYLCFPNSVASTSMWMILPSMSCMRLFTLQVLSENLLPMEMTRSASFIAILDAILPCIPRGPMLRSYDEGMIPIPMSVTSTGARRRSASSLTSLHALIAPPPTSMTGFFASLIHLMAWSIPERSSGMGLTPYSSSM